MIPANLLERENASLRRQLEERTEEIAQLRRELKGDAEESVWDAISVCSRLTPQEAWIIAALYGAKGQILSRERLNSFMPSHSGSRHAEDREPKVIDVMLLRIRRKLHPECVDTVWGRGLRLSQTGIALVERMIAGERLSKPTTLPLRSQSLTLASAGEIKGLYGKVSAAKAAERFGVARATVYAIWRGDRWPGVAGVPEPQRASA